MSDYRCICGFFGHPRGIPWHECSWYDPLLAVPHASRYPGRNECTTCGVWYHHGSRHVCTRLAPPPLESECDECGVVFRDRCHREAHMWTHVDDYDDDIFRSTGHPAEFTLEAGRVNDISRVGGGRLRVGGGRLRWAPPLREHPHQDFVQQEPSDRQFLHYEPSYQEPQFYQSHRCDRCSNEYTDKTGLDRHNVKEHTSPELLARIGWIVDCPASRCSYKQGRDRPDRMIAHIRHMHRLYPELLERVLQKKDRDAHGRTFADCKQLLEDWNRDHGSE